MRFSPASKDDLEGLRPRNHAEQCTSCGTLGRSEAFLVLSEPEPATTFWAVKDLRRRLAAQRRFALGDGPSEQTLSEVRLRLPLSA